MVNKIEETKSQLFYLSLLLFWNWFAKSPIFDLFISHELYLYLIYWGGMCFLASCFMNFKKFKKAAVYWFLYFPILHDFWFLIHWRKLKFSTLFLFLLMSSWINCICLIQHAVCNFVSFVLSWYLLAGVNFIPFRRSL